MSYQVLNREEFIESQEERAAQRPVRTAGNPVGFVPTGTTDGKERAALAHVCRYAPVSYTRPLLTASQLAGIVGLAVSGWGLVFGGYWLLGS